MIHFTRSTRRLREALSALACFYLLGCGNTGTEPNPNPTPDNETPSGLTGAYFGQSPPGMTPVLFVPEELRSNETWFWHGALAFAPGGTEFYLDLYYPATAAGIHVRVMRLQENSWSSLQTPSFAGTSGGDASPTFTPDGNKVFFISRRPNGSSYGVWTATRTGESWSAPSPVSIPNNPDLGGGWEVSVTRNETLYLRMRDNTLNTDLDIFVSRLENGSYTEPERLSDEINSSGMDLAMFVDPDENYIIFSSDRQGGVGGSDLYISFQATGGSWTNAANMGSPVNSAGNEGSPYVSPDGEYLFFNSDRAAQYDRNPYWVDAQVIEELRPGG